MGDFLKEPKKIKKEIKNPNELLSVKLNLGGVQIGSNRETLSFGSTTYYERFPGQLIYGKQNFFNGAIAIIPENAIGLATSGDVPALDIIGIYSSYIFRYISREKYWKSKETEATGTGSKRIHEKTLFNFEILVPSLQEQTKIGNFFKSVDDLITIHQGEYL